MIQHNIRVMERYYSRIKLERLSILVGVSVERTEAELGDMVVKKRLAAKINRLEGVVVFSKKKKFTNERLTQWNQNIKATLDKIEQTCHLINREKIIKQE
jgi:26S proteasome regulatory subunit N5